MRKEREAIHLGLLRGGAYWRESWYERIPYQRPAGEIRCWSTSFADGGDRGVRLCALS